MEPSGRDYELGYDSKYDFQAYVEWVRFDIDSAVGGEGGDYYGCPDPTDARYDQLYVGKRFDIDFFGSGGHYYESDSSFVVNLPAFGCDTIKVYRWWTVGRVEGYLGEGR
jgi:hypothetical protein